MAETRELLIGPRELEFVVHVLTFPFGVPRHARCRLVTEGCH